MSSYTTKTDFNQFRVLCLQDFPLGCWELHLNPIDGEKEGGALQAIKATVNIPLRTTRAVVTCWRECLRKCWRECLPFCMSGTSTDEPIPGLAAAITELHSLHQFRDWRYHSHPVSVLRHLVACSRTRRTPKTTADLLHSKETIYWGMYGNIRQIEE